MVQMRNGPLQPQIEHHADELERQQRQRECDEGQGDRDDADHGRFLGGDAWRCGSRRAVILNATSQVQKKAAPVRRGD
jgi:hypothetical protein